MLRRCTRGAEDVAGIPLFDQPLGEIAADLLENRRRVGILVESGVRGSHAEPVAIPCPRQPVPTG
jgi:hypothetical protein